MPKSKPTQEDSIMIPNRNYAGRAPLLAIDRIKSPVTLIATSPAFAFNCGTGSPIVLPTDCPISFTAGKPGRELIGFVESA